MQLEGKVALVTGFGSGIGQAVAERFAREGAKVAGISRNPESGEQTLRLVREAGGEGIFLPTDIRFGDQVDAAVAEAARRFGGIDVVVNSAGIRLQGTVTDITEEQWDAVLDTNLKGAFLVSRAAIPEMRKRGGGCIINISAISGIHGTPNRVAYSTSKGALNNLTEAMALDHAKEGIRVNCVCPGPTNTPMMGGVQSNPERLAQIGAQVPLGRVGEPEDIVEAVAYLASDAAKHVTGAILAVTGGGHLT